MKCDAFPFILFTSNVKCSEFAETLSLRKNHYETLISRFTLT